MVKRLWLCLVVTLLAGCMPAKVPLPERQRAGGRDEQSYRAGIMFVLGRQSASDAQIDETLAQLTKGGNYNENRQAILAALRRHLREQKQECDTLSQLHPPEKYREFHSMLVNYKRQIAGLSEEILQIVEAQEYERMLDVIKRADQMEAQFKGRLAEIVRQSGSNSLEEYLGL